MTLRFERGSAGFLPWLLLGLVQCSSNSADGNGAAGQSSLAGASSGGRSSDVAGASGTSNASGSSATGGAAGFAVGGSVAQAAGAGGASAGAPASTPALPVPPGDANLPKPSGTGTSVTVLDWAGFKGALSFTFDDTNQSQIDYFDDMNALGLKYTYYLITGANKAAQLDSPVWPKAIQAGHELGNHTRSHQQTDTGADTDAGQMDLENKFKIQIYTMAAPMGDLSYKAVATTRYLVNRGVSGLTIKPNDESDPFNLPCYVPPAGTDQDYAKYLNDAKDGGWDVILIHGFTKKPDGSAEDDAAYQAVDYEKFKSEALRPAKAASDIWTGTVLEIGAYWRAQKLFTGLTPTTSGVQKTWTWTLPDHFPKARHLRVKVDGGTLEQNGSELPWDGHGYYEIALDALSLTLIP